MRHLDHLYSIGPSYDAYFQEQPSRITIVVESDKAAFVATIVTPSARSAATQVWLSLDDGEKRL
jgi:hypothetical protein